MSDMSGFDFFVLASKYYFLPYSTSSIPYGSIQSNLLPFLFFIMLIPLDLQPV